MLIACMESKDPDHFIEIIEIRTSGPTFYFARCRCHWETDRSKGENLAAVEGAARKHLAPYDA